MKVSFRFTCDIFTIFGIQALTMKKHLLTLAFTSLYIFAIYTAKAQTASVKISGEVTTSTTINDNDLHQYTQTTVTRKDHDGKDHTYTGVILAEILKKAGATLGPI